MEKQKSIKQLNPYLLIIASFAGVILLGMICLMMPFTSASGHSIGFVDSLFMATSAVCVTGLSVVTLATDFSIFGKVVMAILMEIGGLSFITLAVYFFTMMGAKITISDSFVLRESLNQGSVKGLTSLVKKIIRISFSVQIICTVINVFGLMKYYDTASAIGISLFHSIAAFNNAGFDIFGDASMIPYQGDFLLNGTTMLMIFIGSMGFIVWDDVWSKKKWIRLRLHSKIVIISTFILIVGGAFLIKWTIQDPSFSWLQAFFESITCRTAGFTTYDLANLKDYPAAYMIFILLMIIGASPCSTGGGIKTTTVAVAILAIFFSATGRKTRAFKRNISEDQIYKAFLLISMAIIIVCCGSFLVSAIQPTMAYADGTKVGIGEIIFEVSSAFSTTGLSMGITALLSPANRLLLCFFMFLGRLGPLTIIGVANKRWMSESKEAVQYVEEKVIIG